MATDHVITVRNGQFVEAPALFARARSLYSNGELAESYGLMDNLMKGLSIPRETIKLILADETEYQPRINARAVVFFLTDEELAHEKTTISL